MYSQKKHILTDKHLFFLRLPWKTAILCILSWGLPQFLVFWWFLLFIACRGRYITVYIFCLVLMKWFSFVFLLNDAFHIGVRQIIPNKILHTIINLYPCIKFIDKGLLIVHNFCVRCESSWLIWFHIDNCSWSMQACSFYISWYNCFLITMVIL